MLSDAKGDNLNDHQEEPVKSVSIRRADDAALSELSDSEFVARLRERLGHRSWSISQFFELERRGLHILEDDPPLQEAIKEARQFFEGSMQKVLTAASHALDPLRERIAEVSLSFPKIEFPRLKELPTASALRESLLAVELIELPKQPVSPSLEMQIAQLEALSEIREEIRALREFVGLWSGWLVVGFMLGGVLGRRSFGGL